MVSFRLCTSLHGIYIFYHHAAPDVKPKGKKKKDERSNSSSLTRAVQHAGDRFTPLSVQGFGRVTCVKIKLNTMFTIMPSKTNTIKVSSFPANLVNAKLSGGCLSFNWSGNVTSITRAGVRVCIPSHMLNSVYLARAATAQILNGFTSLKYIEMFGVSSLNACLTSDVSEEPHIKNQTLSTSNVGGTTTNNRRRTAYSLPGGGRLFTNGNVVMNNGNVIVYGGSGYALLKRRG